MFKSKFMYKTNQNFRSTHRWSTNSTHRLIKVLVSYVTEMIKKLICN